MQGERAPGREGPAAVQGVINLQDDLAILAGREEKSQSDLDKMRQPPTPKKWQTRNLLLRGGRGRGGEVDAVLGLERGREGRRRGQQHQQEGGLHLGLSMSVWPSF